MISSRKQAPDWGPRAHQKPTPPANLQAQASKPWELVRADTLKIEDVKWLWYPYIPAGKVTSIEGDPGVGKSWLTCAIAAAVSTGCPLPGQEMAHASGNVLMMSGEDGLEETVLPRLKAMRADMTRIFFPKELFTLTPDGIRGLEETMKTVAATIVFIDPVQLFMGGKVDMNKANEVRGFMNGLHQAAGRSGSAVLIVRHLRKSSGKELYSGLGSIDFTAAVRSVLQVSADEGNTRYVRQVKNNLAPRGFDLSYTVENKKLVWGPMRASRSGVSSIPRKLSRAMHLLQQEFQSGGHLLAAELQEKLAGEGISGATINRAKKELGIISEKIGDQWYWSVPEVGVLHEPEPQGVPVQLPEDDPEITRLVEEMRSKLHG